MRENLPSHGFTGRALSWLLPFLLLSAAYLYAFPQANVFYAGVVLLHALIGVVAAILLVPGLIRLLRNGSFLERVGWLLVAAGAVLGLILIKTGTPKTEWKWLYLHIVISLAGVGLLIAGQLGRRGWLVSNAGTSILRTAICLALLAGLGYAAGYVRGDWQSRNRIQNPGGPVLPQFGAGLWPAEDPQQVFHGVRFVQAMPRGHLQPVV
jgi:hypothetical protein